MDRQHSRTNISRALSFILVIALILLPRIAFSEETPFLTADEAFKLETKLIQKDKILIHFQIAPGYLLYQEHLQFQLKNSKDIKNITPLLPPAITKHDSILGDYKVYAHDLELTVSIDPSYSELLVTYQGCSEEGFCYAPQTQTKKIDFSNVPLTSSSPSLSTPTEAESELDPFTELLEKKNISITLIAFFGLGLLLAFTPCVLPMIPIMANILVGTEKPLASRRAIFLASLYVLSVAICYAFAGVIAGLAGNHWQITFQQPVFLISLSLLLVLFALSQFNLITIRVPQILSSTLHQLERKQKQGSALGAIGMGFISALMASPCVTPALVGALTYISQTGNALLGGLALFMMSLGMGFPLLGVACIGSRLLPKAGPWMIMVKNITGVLLLVLAGTIIARTVPNNFWNSPDKSNNPKVEFVTIQNTRDLTHYLNIAKKENKLAILDVYATWCISCQRVDRLVFEDPEIKSLDKNYAWLRLDMTEIKKETEELVNELKIIGPPTIIFFDTSGQEIKNLRLVGEVTKSDFLKQLYQGEQLVKLPSSSLKH